MRALVKGELDLYAGEVTALIGENGAGKSTMVKILTGVHHADEGVIRLNGQPVHLIADSGAFFSTIEDKKAAELKLEPNNHRDLIMRGVNGEVAARVEIARQFTVLHHTYKDLVFITVSR